MAGSGGGGWKLAGSWGREGVGGCVSVARGQYLRVTGWDMGAGDGVEFSRVCHCC